MLIKLKRDGYDEYLDYLKGMSIIMVLINHGAQNIVDMALFPIWIYEAVPMFLLIQVFHAYKKRTVQNPSIKKIWERILRPFVYTQIVFIAYCFYAFIKRGISIDEYFLDYDNVRRKWSRRILYMDLYTVRILVTYML